MQDWLDYYRMVIEGMDTDLQNEVGQRYCDMGKELKDHGAYVKRIAKQNKKVRKMFPKQVKEGEIGRRISRPIFFGWKNYTKQVVLGNTYYGISGCLSLYLFFGNTVYHVWIRSF